MPGRDILSSGGLEAIYTIRGTCWTLHRDFSRTGILALLYAWKLSKRRGADSVWREDRDGGFGGNLFFLAVPKIFASLMGKQLSGGSVGVKDGSRLILRAYHNGSELS